MRVTIVVAVVDVACVLAKQVELNGHTFTLPDGFTIELAATQPQVDRPIVADFDESGRLYVADSSGSNEPVEKQLAAKPHRIVRLEDTAGTGRFDRSIVFADRMMFPAGAMWRDGSLYVSAPPSIWKLTDNDGDAVVDERVEWFAGKTLTGCANDLHGPYAAPDGFVYWCKGAFAEQTYPRPGTAPLVTRAAHIFRSRPDGSQIEPVMTGGMDNPVDVVFTDGGERIFTTTFLQNPAGGRRDGLIHAIYGGVYGKQHNVIDDHVRTSRDLMPVLSHLGPAAPCGLVCYQSHSFGQAYHGNLFAALFNLHKITRHVLIPNGATFMTRDEDFLVAGDLDFHPTDVVEDADGSLLVVDTGGWYKLCCPTSQLVKPDVLGAIYRIRRTDAPKIDDPRGLKLAWDTLSPAGLAELLADARPAVREQATQRLAKLGEKAVPAIAAAAQHTNAPARNAAVWAATRIDHAGARQLVRQLLTDEDETVRQAAIHSASVRRDRLAVGPLVALLSNPSVSNRRAAAEALGRLGDQAAVAPLLAARSDDALAKSHDPADTIRASDRSQVLEHSLVYSLVELAAADATATGLASENSATRRRAMVALDQMPGAHLSPAAVIASLDSPDERLRDTAAWIAGRHAAWGEALADWLQKRLNSPALSEDERSRLLPLCARFARVALVQAFLAERLADGKTPLATRQLILQAMVDAHVKPTPPAWIAAIASVLQQRRLSQQPFELTNSAVAAVRALPIPAQDAQEMIAQLVEIVDEMPIEAAPANDALRVAALAAVPGGLAGVTSKQFAFLQQQLQPDSPVINRAAAADVISHAKLTAEQMLALVETIKTAGPLEIDRLLAAFAQSTDDALGLKLVAALQQSAARTSLRMETLKPRLERFGPAVHQQADALYTQLRVVTADQQAKLEKLLVTLPAGDVRRGQEVFNGKKAVCSACHAIGYLGGNIGPDLTQIGRIRSRRDLVESIVFPSASFVRSYEPVVATTTDGKTISGVVRGDSPTELIVATGANQFTHIARGDIDTMQPGTISVMPAGLDQQLSEQELADLVAFLQAAK